MTTEEATIDFLKGKIKEIVSTIAVHDISEKHWVSNGWQLQVMDRYTHLRNEIINISKETLGEKATNDCLFNITLSPEEMKNECTG